MRQPRQATDPLAGLLLEIKDEIDEAKAERRALTYAFNRFNHVDPGRAVDLAKGAQESAQEARQSLLARRREMEARNARLRLLTALCGAVGAILVVSLCLWGWLTFAAEWPWLCEAVGASHGFNDSGIAYCAVWDVG